MPTAVVRFRRRVLARAVPFAAAVIVTAATLPTAAAHGWGNDGHKIVCGIAIKLLAQDDQNKLEQMVRAYRPPDGQGYSHFTQACTFADKARSNARSFEDGDASLASWERFGKFENWHFLNVARTEHDIEAADCHGDCVLKGIETHRTSSPHATEQSRTEALILLGHWVGDIHQPLHVSFKDDRGGNKINRIRGGFYSNGDLHAVWDSGIISNARGDRDWWTYAGDLTAAIDQAKRTTWEQSEPLDWANESYRITIEDDADYCEMQGSTCRSEGRTRTLDSSYQTRFQPVVESRLQQAGVRLAKLVRASLHGSH